MCTYLLKETQFTQFLDDEVKVDMNSENNLILITIDCLRPDHLSCLGYHGNNTLHIDHLARKGALFRQAISNGPNTYCSFPSIMTSTYAMMNCFGKETGYPYRWIFLSLGNATIAEVLQRNGYSTAAFHTNPWISSFFHYNRGFEVFYDSLDEPLRSSFRRRGVKVGSSISYYLSRSIGLYQKLRNKQEMSAHWLNQKALSWLKKHYERKFFLWLHYMDVHIPLIPPGLTFFQRLNAIKLDYKIRRSYTASDNEFKTLIDLYDKEIKYVDCELGLFVNKLDEMGISSDNTYFVITADHGEQLMEHGFVAHGLLYDEVIRVPLIMVGPGIDSSIVIQDQVSLLDLAPTIVEFLDIDKPKNFCGASLMPIIEGKKVEKTVFSENLRPAVSLRTEDWKCIVSFYGEEKVELYDLKEDPLEANNLAAQKKDIARRFKYQAINHIQREHNFRKKSKKKEAFDNTGDKRDQKRLKARLQALGYS